MQASHKSNSESRKRTFSRAQGANSRSDDLTCNEGQVEDLLSEGESTGDEGTRPQKPTAQKVFSSKTASVNVLRRKQV